MSRRLPVVRRPVTQTHAIKQREDDRRTDAPALVTTERRAGILGASPNGDSARFYPDDPTAFTTAGLQGAHLQVDRQTATFTLAPEQIVLRES